MGSFSTTTLGGGSGIAVEQSAKLIDKAVSRIHQLTNMAEGNLQCIAGIRSRALGALPPEPAAEKPHPLMPGSIGELMGALASLESVLEAQFKHLSALSDLA